MNIDSLNSSAISLKNLYDIQQKFSTGMLKESLSNQKETVTMLLNSLPDPAVGQNVDILA